MKLYYVVIFVLVSLMSNVFAEKVNINVPGVSINVQGVDGGSAIIEQKAGSSGVTISVGGSDDFSTEKVKYICGDQDVIATYINANDIALVQLDFIDKTIVAANVLSASGSQYAGDQYVWWENEGDVTLFDAIKDPEKKKPIACREEENSTGE